MDDYDTLAHRPANLALTALQGVGVHNAGRGNRARARQVRSFAPPACRMGPPPSTCRTCAYDAGRVRCHRRVPTATRSTATRSDSTRSASRSASSARSSTCMPDRSTTAPRTRRSRRHRAARIDESMEALIHHFKLFTDGFKVPEPARFTCRLRAPRGESWLLHRVSDGSRRNRIGCTSEGRVVREPPDDAPR